MINPWTDIKLEDYENHMKSASVRQLQALERIMKSQLDCPINSSVMILGVAGGNGLNHINPDIIKSVYGVDINREYLKECVSDT